MQDETQRVEQQSPPQQPAPTQPAPTASSEPTRPPEAAPRVGQPAPASAPSTAPLITDDRATPRGYETARAEPAYAPMPAYDHEHVEPMYLPMALSVGAGFKFGCGFMLAIAVTALVLFLVFSVLFFVATLVGVPLPLFGLP